MKAVPLLLQAQAQPAASANETYSHQRFLRIARLSPGSVLVGFVFVIAYLSIDEARVHAVFGVDFWARRTSRMPATSSGHFASRVRASRVRLHCLDPIVSHTHARMPCLKACTAHGSPLAHTHTHRLTHLPTEANTHTRAAHRTHFSCQYTQALPSEH
eukprot:2166562-Rhodomonas_salina.3